ncbi:hypothetical protein EVAR_76439_1 [Eumeta japonica]|uniref:Uncharacterized protein n=1 Tax=Eumeta variegata TaxID=151549 RepID=A0A4C1T7Z9_EUMVA|nr:hypothetical protein EVAR_76439_1 [Eumeta japonica]
MCVETNAPALAADTLRPVTVKDVGTKKMPILNPDYGFIDRCRFNLSQFKPLSPCLGGHVKRTSRPITSPHWVTVDSNSQSTLHQRREFKVARSAHAQENTDSHIYQGFRSIKLPTDAFSTTSRNMQSYKSNVRVTETPPSAATD